MRKEPPRAGTWSVAVARICVCAPALAVIFGRIFPHRPMLSCAEHKIRWQGGRSRIALADGMLRCSMYDSLDDFMEGWKRIYLEVCRRRPSSLRRNGVRVFINGVILPLLQLTGLIIAPALWTQGHATLSILLATVVMAGLIAPYSVLAVIYRMSGAPISSIWFYPIGCYYVSRAFFAAASDLVHRRPIRWGGREYIFEPRT